QVEYLYMLVCQTLDCISNKRREKLPTSLGPDGRDADATFMDKEEEFLSLDDIPETSQASVDMRRDQQPAVRAITHLMPPFLPPFPPSVPSFPFLRRGEVLASRRDFRMNTSTPHASGAFLLELAGLSPTHPQQEQLQGTATGTRGALGWHCHPRCPCQRLTCRCPPAAAAASAERPACPVQALSFSEEADRVGVRGSGSFCSLCLFPPLQGAAGPDDDDDIPGALGDDMEVTPVPNEHIEAQRVCVGRSLGGLPVLLPWNPSALPQSSRPPEPWRPFLVPHGLEDVVGGKRKRRGPRKLQDFTRWFSAVYNNTSTESRKSRRRGPTFADLEVLYWRQFKERMAVHRKLQSRGGCSSPQEPLWEQELEQERGANSEEGADDDFVEHEDVEHEDIEPEAPEELGEGSLGGLGVSPFLSLCPQELFMASSQKFAQETELSQRIRLWEERMEPLLQEQARTQDGLGAPGWAGTPGECRAPFSVRAYGQALTQRCAEPGRWHSLASLVAGQPPFEVCRYLLASLQLANDAEVELAQEAGLEEALDTARLRLLSARPAHERFQNFQLPSQR
ncbi:CNDH2 protein, partial [Locustella ochotensis]|nr:CNDH2 protein [Locustella ochotensis]